MGHPLSVDLAWSEEQAERWGLTPPEEAVRVAGYLGLTYYRAPEPVVFYALPEVAGFPLTALRHLAGVAELRLRLGVPPDPEAWRVSRKRLHPVEEPDAVWFTPEGPVAVEYDAGGYSRARVRAKGEAFARRFVGQVWGAPVPERVAYLKALLPGGRVLEAPWV
jgi:hypothetical protein